MVNLGPPSDECGQTPFADGLALQAASLEVRARCGTLRCVTWRLCGPRPSKRTGPTTLAKTCCHQQEDGPDEHAQQEVQDGLALRLLVHVKDAQDIEKVGRDVHRTAMTCFCHHERCGMAKTAQRAPT